MPTVDERLGLLEGRVQDHHGALVEIRDAIRDLRGDMMDRFTQNDGHLARIEGRIDRLDEKIDRHFLWLLGIEMASLITVVGALAAALSR